MLGKFKSGELEFVLTPEAWDAFVGGRTNYELYLPKTDAWSERIFATGWNLKAELCRKTVPVRRKGGSGVICVKLLSSTVRMMPLHPYERTDKHIVLYTKKI